MGSSGPGDARAVRDHGAKGASVANGTRDVLPTLGPVTSAGVPSVMTHSTKLRMGRQIVLPFVERSTRYAIHLDFSCGIYRHRLTA
jgi:hypothetical protein